MSTAIATAVVYLGFTAQLAYARAVTYDAGLGNIAMGMGTGINYAAMQPRNLQAVPEFPAIMLHGFEGHNYKRQEADMSEDTNLHIHESWYWGPSKAY